jgi:hypothetical protein
LVHTQYKWHSQVNEVKSWTLKRQFIQEFELHHIRSRDEEHKYPFHGKTSWSDLAASIYFNTYMFVCSVYRHYVSVVEIDVSKRDWSRASWTNRLAYHIEHHIEIELDRFKSGISGCDSIVAIETSEGDQSRGRWQTDPHTMSRIISK